jgi:hypothetical protein
VHRAIASSLLGAVTMLAALAPTSSPAQTTQAGADQPFRLEWSKDGPNVNGYVYNTTSRYAGYLTLLVEGVDASGKVVNSTKTWVRDVPPNNRSFFGVSVPDALSYRISILSYSWLQEIARTGDHREAVPVSDVYSKETLDRYFRLEWSKNGRKVNGYVYNSSNRRVQHMQLLVEGVDAAGNVVNTTKTWVRDVPPNNRAFFETPVLDAPSYRVSVLTFDWIDDRTDRRRTL